MGHGFSGVWEVTYSMVSEAMGPWGAEGHINMANLYLNGERISESHYLTYGQGDVGSLGSRTLYMRLGEGDEVTLSVGLIFVFLTCTVLYSTVQYSIVYTHLVQVTLRSRTVSSLRYVSLCLHLAQYDSFP